MIDFLGFLAPIRSKCYGIVPPCWSVGRVEGSSLFSPLTPPTGGLFSTHHLVIPTRRPPQDCLLGTRIHPLRECLWRRLSSLTQGRRALRSVDSCFANYYSSETVAFVFVYSLSATFQWNSIENYGRKTKSSSLNYHSSKLA